MLPSLPWPSVDVDPVRTWRVNLRNSLYAAAGPCKCSPRPLQWRTPIARHRLNSRGSGKYDDRIVSKDQTIAWVGIVEQIGVAGPEDVVLEDDLLVANRTLVVVVELDDLRLGIVATLTK